MSYKGPILEEQHKENQKPCATTGQKAEPAESLSALLWTEKQPKYNSSRLYGNVSLRHSKESKKRGQISVAQHKNTRNTTGSDEAGRSDGTTDSSACGST